MFEDEKLIVSSENQVNDAYIPEESPGSNKIRKIILWAALAAALLLVVLVIFFVLRKYSSPVEVLVDNAYTADQDAEDFGPVSLPDLNVFEKESPDISVPFSLDVSAEYLGFNDFYQAPDNNFTPNFNDYNLPLNVKIDVMNYYDVSRKLNLDPQLDNLNEQGFALIDNPWGAAAANFSALYTKLDDQQIPLLLTQDFMVYYYQNILKKVFKDIEENVFYNNLWDVNKDLYQAARTRYENRLAEIGNINDPVLEAQRLEAVFFAVALELLKPTASQIAPRGTTSNRNLFSIAEAEKLNFVLPTYLQDDVAAEVALIRAARAVSFKSPVLLYQRDYTDFIVPNDYKANAKLNNFYLTSRWLNSVFPLHYRGQSCPDCLLDRADWRINLTAAAFIAHDFSSLPDLKNKWARIYKIVSFFRGLREDLNYIHYRDALSELFGEDYNIADLFGADNPEAIANLESFRVRLLGHEWPAISGAISKTGNERARLGFKMLAESYWPNDYIFRHLTGERVGVYMGANAGPMNISLCRSRASTNRCGGLSLDVVNLLSPINGHPYFDENSNYSLYQKEATALRSELTQNNIWQANNYWATLSLIKSSLALPATNRPLFARSASWRDYSLNMAAGAWINLQLPLHKFSLTASSLPDQGLSFVRTPEHSYVIPDLPLINEILSQAEMMLKMFTLLQVDAEVRLAISELRNFVSRMNAVKELALKVSRGESLSTEDNILLASFVREMQVEAPRILDQQLNLPMPSGDNLRLDLSQFKLLVVIHRDGDNNVFAVGPVWNYRESR